MMRKAESTPRGVTAVATGLLLAVIAGCAKAPVSSAEPSKPQLGDAHARAWRLQPHDGGTTEVFLELVAAADTEPTAFARCPGPFIACAEQQETSNGRLELAIRTDRDFWSGNCLLQDVTTINGAHVCGGVFEGLQVELETVGTSLSLRLRGNHSFPERSIELPAPLVLARVDPVDVAFARASSGGNSSAETAHLRWVEGATKGADPRDAVRQALTERGVDPLTVPIARLQRLFSRLRSYGLFVSSPAQQNQLLREVVDEEFHKAPKADAAALTPPADAVRVSPEVTTTVLKPGDGERPAALATVRIAYSAVSGAPDDLRRLSTPLAKLAPNFRTAILAMSRGERRRLFMNGLVVDLQLDAFGVMPEPPAKLEAPADATTGAGGLRYVLLHRIPDGKRPTAQQGLVVRHTAWNAAGRVLTTTAWSAVGYWNSLEFVGDSSPEVAAANLLRIGERARFWIPPDHPSRERAANPAEQPAVFDVELVGVQ